jgi:DNA repair protein RadC
VATKRCTPGVAEPSDLFDAPPETMAREIGVEGHRLRLRERFLTAGPEALADHEMLDLVQG